MVNANSVGPLPSFDLKGQVALVTGAARGLGNAISLALANAGAHVALGLREKKTGAELASQIESLGRKALPLQMDVTKRSEISSAVAETVKTFGRIDILVNNAGGGAPNPAEDVTEADFDYTLDLNVKGTFFVSQEVGRVMIKQRSGKIVMLGSQAGFVGLATESVYCTTKAAIHHLTKCLALEWGKYGITVNAVAPTYIRTPAFARWESNEVFYKDLLSKIPLGRVGDPVDVSGAVVFLASPAAALITGATLLIDGGFTTR